MERKANPQSNLTNRSFMHLYNTKQIHEDSAHSSPIRVGARYRDYIVIPFELSKLVNKDCSLVSTLLSDTLQFLPHSIEHLAEDISSLLFTQFNYSKALLPLPRPTFVVGIEILQTRFIDFTDVDFASVSDELKDPSFYYPDQAPWFREFEIDWDMDEEYWISTSREDQINDLSHCYTDDVICYVNQLREYAGEGGIRPPKERVVEDVPRGLVEVKPNWNGWFDDLTGEICQVCHETFEDLKDVYTTPCFHAFHIRCFMKWLSRDNKSCPTCRGVRPWDCDVEYWIN